MTEHYFSKKPLSKSSPRQWNYRLRGKDYTFESDYGVFSKNEVDYGSRLLIERFDEPDIAGDFLDLGCGYGPIGITLADCFNERKVILTDINERAVTLAEQNARHNKVENTEFLLSDLFSNINNRSFAAVVTNPPIRAGKKIVHQLFEDSKASLLKHGQLWTVIQKKQGASSAREKLHELFGNVKVIARDKGYFILQATKV